MGKRVGFGVDSTNDPSEFNDRNLKRYDALIFASTNHHVFDNDDEKLALMHYIEAGGGFVGLHSVTCTERAWPWFVRLVGATFVRHAPFQQYTDVITDTTNPSTSFLPRRWRVNDERYYVKNINPDTHVLAVEYLTSVKDTGKPTMYGSVFPSVWCHEFDGGREWNTDLGHAPKTYSDPLFEKHILGGLRWAIGENKPLDYSKAKAKSPDDPLPY